MFNVRVKGDRMTIAKLERMAKRVENKRMREELKDAMAPVLSSAKSRAPTRSGRLQRSIRASARATNRSVSASVATGTRRQLKIPANNPYYYPAAVEFGTRKMPARPFLRPAMKTHKNKIIRSLSASTKRKLLRP